MGWAKDSALTKEASNVGIAIGVIALLQAAVLSLGFTSLTSDEYTRTLFAASWAKTHRLPSDQWLPGHFWILGTALKIHYDLFLTPRIVTYVFSLQCLIALYLLARYLFNRWVALISIYILGSMQIYVYLSLTPLVDMVYYSFLLWFLYFLLRWLEQSRPAPFFAAALMLGLATTLRYEAWFIAALFSIYLLVRSIAELERSRLPGTLTAIAVVCIVPCLWLAGSYISHGNPLFIMGAFGGWIRFRLETESISNWAALLFRTGSHICLLGIAGIWLSTSIIAREKLCLYFGLTFAPLALVSVFTTGPGTVYPERYAGQYLLPLIPFCAHAVNCALTATRYRFGQLHSWPVLAIFSIFNLWLVYLKISGHGGRLISLLALAGISLSWRLLELRRWMLLAASLSPLALFIVLPRTRFALTTSDALLRLYFLGLLIFYGLYLLRAKYSAEHRAAAEPSLQQWRSLGTGLLSIVLLYGLWGTFVDHPDFSRDAARAGFHVRRLFDEKVLRKDTKVLMQVTDWDFIVIPSMSNHPENFMFDRYPYKDKELAASVPAADNGDSKARRRRRRPPVLEPSFLQDENVVPYEWDLSSYSYRKDINPLAGGSPAQLHSYLGSRGIGLVILKDPALEELLVAHTDFRPHGQVAGYRFYTIGSNFPK